MKHFWQIILLLSTQLVLSQNIVIIDSVQNSYQNEIKSIYQERVDGQKQVFKNRLKRKIRKEVTQNYEEATEAFIVRIESGYFADNLEYKKLFDQILQKIIAENPEYAKDLSETKVLLSYGISPNAYAIGNNILVIYIPLIKKISNEYELTFIICHELSHNLLQHSIRRLEALAKLNNSKKFRKKTRQIEHARYNRGVLARDAFKNTIYNFRHHTRKQEQQADSLGFVLFKNAFPQHVNEVVISLNSLDKIDKVRDSLSAKDFKQLLGTSQQPLRDDLLNNAVLENYKYDHSHKFWEIDSLKTHPNSKARAAFIVDKFHLEKRDTISSKPSSLFKKLKISSQYNDVLGQYRIKSYGYSLYWSLVLLKNHPDDNFLKNLVYKNLKQIQKARKTYTLGRFMDSISPLYSDSYNTFIYIIRNLHTYEIETLINHYKNPS